MRFLIIFITGVLFGCCSFGAPKWQKDLSIGSGDLDVSSILDVNSTTKGARPCPSMTEAQRDAISTPAEGLCIYNTTSSALNVYSSAAWGEVGGGIDWSTPVDSNIVPDGDATRALGTTGAQFSELWTPKLTSDGTITLETPDQNTPLLIQRTGADASKGEQVQSYFYNSADLGFPEWDVVLASASNSTITGTGGFFFRTGDLRNAVTASNTTDVTGAITMRAGDLRDATGTSLAAGATTGSMFFSSGRNRVNLDANTGFTAMRTGPIDNAGATGDTGPLSLRSGYNNGVGDTGTASFYSGNAAQGDSGGSFVSTGTASGTSGDIGLTTGNADISGNIVLTTGTGTTTRGDIRLINGTEGQAGKCWMSTDASGSGNWQTCAGVEFLNVNSLSGTAGTGNGVEVPYNAVFSELTNFSVTAFFKTTNSNSAFGVMFAHGGSGATDDRKWYIHMNNGEVGGAVSADGSNTNVKYYESTATYNDGNWHLLTLTFAPNDMRIYVDGTELVGGAITKITDAVVNSANNNTTDDITLGSFYDNNTTNPQLAFNGLTDEFQYYNKTLSAAEVTELWNGGVTFDFSTSSFSANLQAWWRIDGNTLPNITEEIASNDGLVVGNLTISTDALASGAGGGGGIAWSDPVDSTLTPLTNDTYDLGTNAALFRNAYLSKATIGENVAANVASLSVTAVNGAAVGNHFWNLSLPSGATANYGIANPNAGAFGIGLTSTGDGTGNSSNTGPIDLETGNKSSASNTGVTGAVNLRTGNNSSTTTGGSGDIVLQTGTVVNGPRGEITANSSLLNVLSGVATTKLTADPCADTIAFPESTLFYNDTSDYYCFCDGAAADVQMHAPATACF